MGILKLLFGKRPKSEPVVEPEPAPAASIVPIGSGGQFGIMPSSFDTATLESAEQMRALALHLAQTNSVYDYHSQMVETVIEQAQRLYGRQVGHQSRLQELQRQRFPIELLAAQLFQPPPVQSQSAEPRRSSLKSRAGKIARE